MVKEVIFDVDGTLVDSNELHVEAWNIAFRKFGLVFPLDRLRSQIGKGADQYIPAFLTPGQVKEFAAGAAWMAIKAQMPLVPLTIVGTYELLPIHHLTLWPRRLKLVVGEPISTVGLTTKDAEALTERLRDVIAATYAEHHG